MVDKPASEARIHAVSDALDSYRSKRDLDRTPEPGGAAEAAGEGNRFVIQEHHASSLHWDLRLEHDGVLASWALPKGVPIHPDENRLAVRTEDHPLEYLDFHGEIPAGSYGAGTMEIWDSGTYETEKFRDKEVMVVLHGERVQGRYVLFATRGKDWMIHRMDPPEPGVEPMPEDDRSRCSRGSASCRATRTAGPTRSSGTACARLAFVEAGHLTLTGRNGTDFTPRYPELRAMATSLGMRRLVLDGEVVALDDAGPAELRAAAVADAPGLARPRSGAARASVPVTYIAFDLLWLEGRSALSLPYADRRRLLAGLELEGPHWRTPAYREGDGAALLEASAQQQLEGIVAKRLDAPYEPGRRSGAWRKIKNRPSQDVVVGGWLRGEGGRASTLGALAVGVRDEPGGALRYAGKVGSGFTGPRWPRPWRRWSRWPPTTRRSTGRQPPKGTQFVEPELVAHVEFGEWTRTGTLRAPVFRGLREDVDAHDVVREEG